MSSEVSNAPVGQHVSPEALEAEPRPWYDDLNIFSVFVAGFISTVLTVVIICLVQGLYFHWEMDEIRNKTAKIISPGEQLLDQQRKTLSDGIIAESLSGTLEGELYYRGISDQGLVPLDQAKAKVLAKFGEQASQ